MANSKLTDCTDILVFLAKASPFIILSWKSAPWLNHTLYTSNAGHMICANQGKGQPQETSSRLQEAVSEACEWPFYRSQRKLGAGLMNTAFSEQEEQVCDAHGEPIWTSKETYS